MTTTVTMTTMWIIQNTLTKMNWTNYTDIYDLYINGKKERRIWGAKRALKVAQNQSGELFEKKTVWLINIHTGVVVFDNRKGGAVMK